MRHRPVQYSLAALFALLTASSLVLAYFRAVGIWAFALALGPPLFIAAVFNVIVSPDTWFVSRVSKEHQEWTKIAPDLIRVLVSLVLGFLIWVPVLAILNWR